MTNNFFYNVNNLFNDEKINFLKKKHIQINLRDFLGDLLTINFTNIQTEFGKNNNIQLFDPSLLFMVKNVYLHVDLVEH